MQARLLHQHEVGGEEGKGVGKSVSLESNCTTQESWFEDNMHTKSDDET
jgi:hypothetical protein